MEFLEGPISAVGHCRDRNCEHKDASLSCTASQLGANQQTPFLPPEHTFDRGDTEDVSYEVEVENSEQHGGKLFQKNSRNYRASSSLKKFHKLLTAIS